MDAALYLFKLFVSVLSAVLCVFLHGATVSSFADRTELFGRRNQCSCLDENKGAALFFAQLHRARDSDSIASGCGITSLFCSRDNHSFRLSFVRLMDRRLVFYVVFRPCPCSLLCQLQRCCFSAFGNCFAFVCHYFCRHLCLFG